MNFFKSLVNKTPEKIESVQPEVTTPKTVEPDASKEPLYNCYLEIFYKDTGSVIHMGTGVVRFTLGRKDYVIKEFNLDAIIKQHQLVIKNIYDQLNNKDSDYINVNDTLLIHKSDFILATLIFGTK